MHPASDPRQAHDAARVAGKRDPVAVAPALMARLALFHTSQAGCDAAIVTLRGRDASPAPPA